MYLVITQIPCWIILFSATGLNSLIPSWYRPPYCSGIKEKELYWSYGCFSWRGRLVYQVNQHCGFILMLQKNKINSLTYKCYLFYRWPKIFRCWTRYKIWWLFWTKFFHNELFSNIFLMSLLNSTAGIVFILGFIFFITCLKEMPT